MSFPALANLSFKACGLEGVPKDEYGHVSHALHVFEKLDFLTRLLRALGTRSRQSRAAGCPARRPQDSDHRVIEDHPADRGAPVRTRWHVHLLMSMSNGNEEVLSSD